MEKLQTVLITFVWAHFLKSHRGKGLPAFFGNTSNKNQIKDFKSLLMEGNHIYSLISNVVPTQSGSPPPTFPTVSATLGGQHQQRHISAFVHDNWAFPRVNDGTSTFERGELRRRVTRGAVQTGSSVVTGLQMVRQVRRHLLETRSVRLQLRRQTEARLRERHFRKQNTV